MDTTKDDAIGIKKLRKGWFDQIIDETDFAAQADAQDWDSAEVFMEEPDEWAW